MVNITIRPRDLHSAIFQSIQNFLGLGKAVLTHGQIKNDYLNQYIQLVIKNIKNDKTIFN